MLKSLRKIREDKGWTQKDLGDRTMLTQFAISRLERGQRCGNIVTVVNLANALGVTIEELLADPAEDNEGGELATKLAAEAGHTDHA